MRSLRFFTTILFVILISSFVTKKKLKHFNPEKIYSVQELQEDFTALRRGIEKKQPNLYLYTSKQRMDVVFDSMFSGITKPMNFYEFFSYITPICSFIKDGHNLISPGEAIGNYADKYQAYLPLHISSFDGKLYADKNYSKDTSLFDGAEILSINGKSATQIRNDFLLRMVRDGENTTLPEWIMNTYFRGFFGFLSGFPTNYSVAYVTKEGAVVTTNLSAMPIDSILKVAKTKYAANVAAQRIRTGIQLRFDSLSKTAILSVQTFDADLLKKQYHLHFKKVIDKMFLKIDSAKSETLIIDVRDNGGGNPVFSRYLLQHIMKDRFVYAEGTLQTRRFNPGHHWNRLAKCRVVGFGKGSFSPLKNAFKGKIIVLINGGSFSASGEFASVLSRYKRAIFVGEETGGNRTICGGRIFDSKLVLPHTRIVCFVGTEATVIRNINENDGHGTMPDYFVKNNLADIIGVHDAIMEFALSLVRK